jgi:ribosome-associated protein
MATMSNDMEIITPEERLKLAKKCTEYIWSQKGKDLVLLDFEGQSSIADFFIITTVESQGQMKGLMRNLQDFFVENDLPSKGGKKSAPDEDWNLIDCSFLLIHVMTQEAREFYDLEKLWFQAKRIELNLE